MEKPERTFWSTQCVARLCSTAVWPKPGGSGPSMWSDTLNSHPCLAFYHRVSPLHRNLQVVNFQRHKCTFHHHQAWVTLQLAPPDPVSYCSLLPPLHPPGSNSSCLFTWCQPLCVSCCAVLLYFTLYCKIKNVFCLFFFMDYLCEKYYKPITVQDYIADC